MPTFNGFSFELAGNPQAGQQIPHPSANQLAVNGPVLPVQIEAPLVLAQALQAMSQPVPNPVVGFALIDTGASITAIDASVFRRLNVNPNGTATVGTAGGPHQQSTFSARLSFPGTPLPTFDHSRALGCDLTGQNVFGGQPVIALIGRDILSRCVLVYLGGGGTFSLSF